MSTWLRKCPLVIDHTKVTAAQTDFPVLIAYNSTADNAVNLPSEMLDSGSANKANSDGSDVRFTSDSSGVVPLNYEIVTFVQNATDGNRKAEIWVRVHSLSSTADTTIYVWYGNATATAPAAGDSNYGSQGVWDSGFLGVYHLASGTTLSVNDSTANVKHGTSHSAVAAAGKFGYGLDNPHTNSGFVSLPTISVSTSFTLSVWFNYTTHYAEYPALLFVNTSATPTGLFADSAYGIAVVKSNAISDYIPWASLSTSTWHLIEATWNGTSLIYYLDGSPISATAHSDSNFPDSPYYGAIGHGSGNYFAGLLDEARVSNSVRSATWISTEYANQSAPASFLAVGTPGTGGTMGTGGVASSNGFFFVV